MITQSFDLNLIPEQEPVVVHCDQYDTGEGRLVATLYDGDMVYTPSGTATIQGTKPDGHGFSYSATISGSTVSADLTEQMSIAYGDVRCQFVITETDGRTGTFVFILRVQKSALPDNSDMSESEYSAIEEAVNACNQAVSDAQGYAEDSEESAEDSEAWAVGQRNGVDVPSSDPAYHNNSKYWASQANVTSLGALSDVTLSSPTNGEALVYDGEKWVNGAGGIAKYNRSEANVLGAKNLLKNTASSQTVNGVTFTVNDDGSVTVNGTASANVDFALYGTWQARNNNLFKAGIEYIVTSGVEETGFHIYIQSFVDGATGTTYVNAQTGTFKIASSNEDGIRVLLVIESGASFTNKTFYPMIRLASDPDSTYEPYAMTNRQLTEELANKQDTLTFDSTPTSASTNPVTSGGVYTALANKLSIVNNSGSHNSVYRGESLGTSVTEEQFASIADGTFSDLFIGDYWTINGTVYRIAAFDYWLNNGDTACTTHHAVIVPDLPMYNAKMNDTNITTGGYVGSKMYTDYLATAKTTINTDFGSTHILSHREMLTNAVTDGKASGWAWYDSTVELMNEPMVYGHNAWGSVPGYETGIDKGQLPLFSLEPGKITNRVDWWLRGVCTAVRFVRVSYYGDANRLEATNSFGVRPVFGICG